jgi:hypothetical protein
MSDDAKKADLKLVEAAVSDDPFDLEKLRLSQDFLGETNVKKLLTTVPVRRPGHKIFSEWIPIQLTENSWPSSN